MEQGNKTVLVLCEKASLELAMQMIGQLEEEEIARRISRKNIEIGENETATIWMEAQADIAMSAAVIFITEDAVYSEEWLDAVSEVPADYRLIPVCFPGEIDMRRIPGSLEEINFIPVNEHFFDNIRDSLMTDPAFYSEKNLLMIRWAQWAGSGIDGNLLTDKKLIRAYEHDFQSKLSQERDPYLREQLENIMEYLLASEKYSRRILLSAISRWIFRAALLVLAIIIAVRVIPEYDRASKYDLKIFVDQDLYAPVTECILTTELATNKYQSSDTLYDAYLSLIQDINEPWPQSPVGYLYRQRTLDISVPQGGQFVWSSTDGGRVLIWDTYSGQPAETFQVTDKAIPVLAVSEDGNMAVAADEDGMLYVFSGGAWNSAGISTSISVSGADCEIAGDAALLRDGTSYELYSLGPSGISLRKKETFEHLYAASLSASGEPCLAVPGQGDLLRVRAPFCGETDLDMKGEKIVLCDISGEQLALCTESGRVISVNGSAAQELPVLLEMPVAVRVLDGRTVLLSDIELGTHLFDTDSVFDYGLFFRTREQIRRVWAERGTAVFDNGVFLAPYDLSEILPADAGEHAGGGTVYSGRECTADGGIIRKASITSRGVIVADGNFEGEEIHIVIDPASFLFHEIGYRDSNYWEEIPEDYSMYEEIAGLLDGVPVTVGLRFVPAENNGINDTDFSYILVGMDNGCFNELAINNNNGSCYVTSVYTAPSRSGIVSIQEVPEGYILTDQAGRGWFVRGGVDSETRNGMFRLVRNKLKCGTTEDLISTVSKETAEELGLVAIPGSDGKEWD